MLLKEKSICDKIIAVFNISKGVVIYERTFKMEHH